MIYDFEYDVKDVIDGESVVIEIDGVTSVIGDFDFDDNNKEYLNIRYNIIEGVPDDISDYEMKISRVVVDALESITK